MGLAEQPGEEAGPAVTGFGGRGQLPQVVGVAQRMLDAGVAAVACQAETRCSDDLPLQPIIHAPTSAAKAGAPNEATAGGI